jgi:hypothetical protein
MSNYYRVSKHYDQWFAVEFDDLEDEVGNYQLHIDEGSIVILTNDLESVKTEFGIDPELI